MTDDDRREREPLEDADESRGPKAGAEQAGEAPDLEIDADEPSPDLDEVMRAALASLEGGGAEAPGPEAAASDEGGELERLRAEIAELRDRTIRTLADFENYRKRTERERRELTRYAAADVLRDVVEVVDNLERALAAEGGSDDLKTGVELILRQAHELLRRSGVQRVPALGEPFDPAVHEAVSRVEDPEVAEPLVTDELQPGYLLHERLLRPARVRVAVPAEEPAAEEQEEEPAEEPAG